MMPTDRTREIGIGWRSHPCYQSLFRNSCAAHVRYLRKLFMSLSNVPSGPNFPDEFNVIVEISMHSDPIKY
jgi:hypothetical protein